MKTGEGLMNLMICLRGEPEQLPFLPFHEAVMRQVPQATISLEVEDEMEVKMGDLRKLAKFFMEQP
jgi:hypothetical protein